MCVFNWGMKLLVDYCIENNISPEQLALVLSKSLPCAYRYLNGQVHSPAANIVEKLRVLTSTVIGYDNIIQANKEFKRLGEPLWKHRKKRLK